MIVSALRALGVTVATAGLSVAGLTAPAQAATIEGQVTTRAGLTVRSAPSTHATTAGSIGYGEIVWLDCKVRGTSVDGNDRWYSLSAGLDQWVSARYVRNVGPAPDWCRGIVARTSVGKTTATLTKRHGPSTTDAARGTLAKGTEFTITCKVRSETVGGNPLWYYTKDHRWVAAHYVDNLNGVPGFC